MQVVAARPARRQRARALEERVVRAREVGGAAQDLRQRGTEKVEHGLGGLSRRLRRALLGERFEDLTRALRPAARQFPARAALELARQLGKGARVARAELAPRGPELRPLGSRVPGGANLLRYDERRGGAPQSPARPRRRARAERPPLGPPLAPP